MRPEFVPSPFSTLRAWREPCARSKRIVAFMKRIRPRRGPIAPGKDEA